MGNTANDFTIPPEKKAAYEAAVSEADARWGAFLEFDPSRVEVSDEGPLKGMPFGVKDNISVKGFKMTCGSRILEEFRPVYDATVVARLKKAGAFPVGKTNLDEFGMGSSTENSAIGETSNPWNPDRVVGGSSGGSAAAVAAGLVPFALGTDTGGSVRQPAAFCGVYGLKPTYGALSRYGLAAYASSLETPGIFTADIDLLEQLFDISKGPDPMDQTTFPLEGLPAAEVRKIGYLAPEGLDGESTAGYEESIEAWKKAGYEMVPVTLPELKYVVPAYYTIATAEASANLARYTGIRYGYRAGSVNSVPEMTRNTREAGFGPEVKMRVLLGTYVLRSGFQDQYYIRAQKIRTLIKNRFTETFSQVDALLSPVFPVQAFPKGGSALSAFQQKMADRYTASINLAGLPALSIPSGVRAGLPFGVQLTAPSLGEARLFSAARGYAEVMPPALCPNRIKGV